MAPGHSTFQPSVECNEISTSFLRLEWPGVRSGGKSPGPGVGERDLGFNQLYDTEGL